MDYFAVLDDAILNIASKADIILGMEEGEISTYEDVLICYCFYIASFNQEPTLLSRYIKNYKMDQKKQENDRVRKSLGFYCTPPYISNYIVKNTLAPLIAKIKEDKRIKKKIKKICSLKICDPAVGGGLFLISAHNFLMREIIQLQDEITKEQYSLGQVARMSSKTLYGVDINPECVDFTKMCINLNIAKWRKKNEI